MMTLSALKQEKNCSKYEQREYIHKLHTRNEVFKLMILNYMKRKIN